ncbi:MAG: YebC/PmpR family DNA-binding transcriptional regulator [Bernardetiaceae bacterium]|jgi:YebC/PmpR family DNA-binding regulatory protein|nr:YebC/PmpR family DNA-binding transcriptional regulator [Bernardetiaceae bacterium]
MAGHSRWANIKHKKAASDNKRGKLFTKLVKEIMIATKEGGPHLDGNPRLRLAVQNARGANIPKDTIERAINKGAGVGVDYQELTYEGYGPGGAAIFVEASTDNPIRTIQNVRSYFAKVGGSLGKNGSLEFVFQRKGVFAVPLAAPLPEDDLWALIDAGADDTELADGYLHLTCRLEDFGAVQRQLDDLQLVPEQAGLQRVPLLWKEDLPAESLQKTLKLIDLLEDDDDVQQVYHNLQLPD